MSSATPVSRAITELGQAQPATALPLPVCWALWVSTSGGLWYAIITTVQYFAF